MFTVDFDKLFDDWKERGYSDKDIAMIAGISAVNISKKRKNHVNRELPMTSVINICHEIGVDHMDYIIEVDKESE